MRKLYILILVTCGVFSQAVSLMAQAVASSGVPKGSSSAVSAKAANYKISPNDLLDISVFQENDLKSVVRVSNEGTVTLPLLKEVSVKGLTTHELSQLLQERFSKGYLINPQVNVAVIEFSKRRFTVLGQVQHSGSYEILDQQEITLPQAIAMAGGYTRLADTKKVTVTRNNESGQQVFVLNARDMESGRANARFLVQANDLISIEESNF